MNRLQVGQLIVIGVDTYAEEKPGVTPVNNLEGPELNEVGLVLLVSGRDESMDL